MKDTFQKPRCKVRTAFVVLVPAGILIIGVWLACMAALVLAADPFQPNLIIMIGGTAAVVAMALVTIMLIDRPKETSNGHGPPSTEL